MSRRQAARIFGINRRTVEKMLTFSIPPGYRRDTETRRPKLDGFTGIIDQILEADKLVPKKSGIHQSGFLSGFAMSMILLASSLVSACQMSCNDCFAFA